MKKVLGAIAKVFFLIFSVAILGMMMSYTWGALGILFPNSFVNRLWGMVLFDIAAMAWALAFVFESRSVAQYAFAGIGFLAGFLGTILMVIAEVVLSGQSFVETNTMGMYMVYGFIVVTVLHAALVYAHHAASPTIHQQIEFGIAEGEVNTEAMRQATQSMDENKRQLAHSLTSKMLQDSYRNLNLPIVVDPNVGFVPADPSQIATPAEQKKKDSWYSRFKNTMRPSKAMTKNEQTVVQQVELQDKPEPKTEEPKPGPDAPFPGQ